MNESRGVVRAMFAAVLLFIDGTLNIIYGLAAVGDNTVFHHPTHYLIGNLNSWGWVSIGLGVLELFAAGSLVFGHRHAFGRYVAMVVGALAAIAALLDMQANPGWSLAVFFISVWIVWGVATYQEGPPPQGLYSQGEFATELPESTLEGYSPRPIA